MTALRKKSSPRPTSRTQRLTDARRRRLSRGAASARRAPAGRTRACSLSSAVEKLRHHRAIGVVLEEAVGDGAQAIVGAGERLAHRVLRARIVEPGQQHERAIAHVAVRVLGHGLQQRGHRLRAGVRRTVRDALVRVA